MNTRPTFKQRRNHIGGSLPSGDVQRSHTAVPWKVNTRPTFKQRCYYIGVAFLCGDEQRSRAVVPSQVSTCPSFKKSNHHFCMDSKYLCDEGPTYDTATQNFNQCVHKQPTSCL